MQFIVEADFKTFEDQSGQAAVLINAPWATNHSLGLSAPSIGSKRRRAPS
jgi:hypothetical protein